MQNCDENRASDIRMTYVIIHNSTFTFRLPVVSYTGGLFVSECSVFELFYYLFNLFIYFYPEHSFL